MILSKRRPSKHFPLASWTAERSTTIKPLSSDTYSAFEFMLPLSSEFDNPYQSPGRPSQPVDETDRSRWRRVIVAFAVASAAPVAFGMYRMYQHQIYVASLEPNEASCGTGAFGALIMIFVVGPFCGSVGAGTGWIMSGMNWWSSS